MVLTLHLKEVALFIHGHRMARSNRIQVPDYYHHDGIWNPWTHVLFEGDTVDFWNIKGRQGTVRFGKFVAVKNMGRFSLSSKYYTNMWLSKTERVAKKVAMNELQTVRVYKPEANHDYYNVDIMSACPNLVISLCRFGLACYTKMEQRQ